MAYTMAPTVYLSCFLALLVAGLAQDIKDSLSEKDLDPNSLKLKQVFELFQAQYNRSYSNPKEYARRLEIFAHNLAQAQKMEAEDLGTAEFGMTPFSDLTEEEFEQLHGHQKITPGETPGVGRKVGSEVVVDSVSPSCDWRKLKGVKSPIKQQGNCNCCWAMAAAGNIEALWSIRYNRSVQVSVQELLDCNRCGDGCKGGFVWDAFVTVLNNSGLASEKDYPFRGNLKRHKCLASNYKKVAWIQDFIMLQNNEQTMAEYLAAHGPITVTINMKLLQQYKKGVIKAIPATCDPYLVDHSVLLVGFGKTKSTERRRAKGGHSRTHPHRPIPYWILKNSWGAEWGEEGYFRLHRGSNTCGITKYPFTARVDPQGKKAPVSCPR
ncbi:cathepsin W [Meles meles]|uniref:cathepsin W n=1 Tax=Meles meles TaxID=9662 RepID=UPI001E6A021C|nr:cathepsin W [Meles meles]XP_045873396.1 cathepsin W [Meles meles]XP_045873397.1 cathepsin W [Meles meles]